MDKIHNINVTIVDTLPEYYLEKEVTTFADWGYFNYDPFLLLGDIIIPKREYIANYDQTKVTKSTFSDVKIFKVLIMSFGTRSTIIYKRCSSKYEYHKLLLTL